MKLKEGAGERKEVTYLGGALWRKATPSPQYRPVYRVLKQMSVCEDESKEAYLDKPICAARARPVGGRRTHMSRAFDERP